MELWNPEPLFHECRFGICLSTASQIHSAMNRFPADHSILAIAQKRPGRDSEIRKSPPISGKNSQPVEKMTMGR
jgi:hypothetical protein